MAIEIKELHIRVTVNSTESHSPTGRQSEVATSGQSGDAATNDADAKDAIVAECVEQVLQILRNKMER